MESREGSLSATDVYEQLCALAQMVISYSHLVAVWMKFVTQKNKADFKSVEKWYTYCMVVGCKVIDQRRRFSQKDPKDKYHSDKMKSCSNGSTGCGLDDFDKKGERRPAKLKFLKHFHDKARDFFKKLKFAKNLVQPIRDYIGIVH